MTGKKDKGTRVEKTKTREQTIQTLSIFGAGQNMDSL